MPSVPDQEHSTLEPGMFGQILKVVMDQLFGFRDLFERHRRKATKSAKSRPKSVDTTLFGILRTGRHIRAGKTVDAILRQRHQSETQTASPHFLHVVEPGRTVHDETPTGITGIDRRRLAKDLTSRARSKSISADDPVEFDRRAIGQLYFNDISSIHQMLDGRARMQFEIMAAGQQDLV